MTCYDNSTPSMGPTIPICNHFQTFYLCLFSVVDFHVNSIRKKPKNNQKKNSTFQLKSNHYEMF